MNQSTIIQKMTKELTYIKYYHNKDFNLCKSTLTSIQNISDEKNSYTTIFKANLSTVKNKKSSKVMNQSTIIQKMTKELTYIKYYHNKDFNLCKSTLTSIQNISDLLQSARLSSRIDKHLHCD